MNIIRWRDHAKIYSMWDAYLRLLTGGKLHALVDIALMRPADLDGLMIETDSGQMFCRHEIAYIGMLADRPRRE